MAGRDAMRAAVVDAELDPIQFLAHEPGAAHGELVILRAFAVLVALVLDDKHTRFFLPPHHGRGRQV
jgi:hypothetical protein